MSRLAPEVLWKEGQMLRPQHLQSLQKHQQQLLSQLNEARLYGFGVRTLDIVEAGITNWIFEIHSCEILMPDGTYLVAGETADVAPAEFRDLQETPGTVDVWIGVPIANSLGPNLVPEDTTQALAPQSQLALRRYVPTTVEVRDENTGDNPQSIMCKRLNARLFVGTRPTQGFVTLKIAELVKTSVDADETRVFKLSTRFVPASLNLEAAPRLLLIVKNLLDILEQRSEALCAPLAGRQDVYSDPKFFKRLLQIQSSNSALPILREIARQPLMHPFDAYVQLARATGDLATFAREPRRAPILSRYDHEDPLQSFLDLEACWGELLQEVVSHIDRTSFEFAADSTEQIELTLPPAYLEPGVGLVLGLETELAAAEVEQLFRTGNLLLCSPDEMRTLRRMAVPGIVCSQNPEMHSELHARQGIVFLAIDSQSPYWPEVSVSGRLALRGSLVGDTRFYIYATGLKAADQGAHIG